MCFQITSNNVVGESRFRHIVLFIREVSVLSPLKRSCPKNNILLVCIFITPPRQKPSYEYQEHFLPSWVKDTFWAKYLLNILFFVSNNKLFLFPIPNSYSKNIESRLKSQGIHPKGWNFLRFTNYFASFNWIFR